jgi:hypothetical protein
MRINFLSVKRTCVVIAGMAVVLLSAQAQTVNKKQPSKAKAPASQPVTNDKADASKSAPAAPPEKAPPFAPVAFRPETPVTAYLQNEPEKVYAWVQSQIASIPGKPDQFSTSDEREKYARAISEKMESVGKIPLIGVCQKKYDADRQQYEVKILLSSIKDYSLKEPNPEALNLRRLTVAQANVQRDTYSAQNAYGAKIDVSRFVSDDYVLSFPAGANNEPSGSIVPGSTSSIRLPYRYTFNYLVLSARMPPNEARDNDKQIACMYVFSLMPPYVFTFKERDTPTRDLPFERTSNGFALFGKLDQAAVINRATGAILDQAARQ